MIEYRYTRRQVLKAGIGGASLLIGENVCSSKSVRRKKRISEIKKWRQWKRGLLLEIPFYDPFEDAGDCWFDEEAACNVMDFFPKMLCHIKGPKAGKSFYLARWEQTILANLFGWKRPDGTRRYREAFIEVPRKNGKTSLIAGIVIFGLLFDDERGAEIYSAAADREQAKLVFMAVKGMVLSSTELTMRTKIYQHSIVEMDTKTGIETGSFYKPISAEAGTKHGYNSHIIVVDELHAQPNDELVDVLETSMGSRAQPLLIHITTSDYDKPSICNEKESFAYKIRGYDQNGKKISKADDNSFLPAVWQATLKDDWRKFETWKKANPCLGNSLSVDYIRRKCKKAQETPRFLNTFMRLHLNVKTQTAVRWLDLEQWDKCAEPVIEEQLIGKRCFCGFDLSHNTDTTSVAYVFPPDEDCQLYRILLRVYIPEDNARARELRDHVPYLTWAREGYIKLTPGNVIDHATIKADFEKDYQKFDIQEVAFDRWGFEALRQQLIAEGVDEEVFVSFGMGFVSLSAPSKKLEELVLAGEIAHGGNPVLRWMAGNTVVETDSAENIKPNKKKSTERIDGIVSTIMALGRAITIQEAKPSVYEERGIIEL
jgi:phage terminase large subunit-like protein